MRDPSLPASKGHVLYVAWGFPPAKSGGVFRMMETANALVEDGWRVTVLACDVDDLRRYAGVDMSTLDGVDARVKVARVPFDLGPAETDLRRWDQLRVVDPDGWASQYSERAAAAFPTPIYGLWEKPLVAAARAIHAQDSVDLVIASGGPFVSFEVGRCLRSEYGVPYILDYRDSWSLHQFNDKRIHKAGSRVADAESDLVAGASQVWFVNEAMRIWHELIYPSIVGRTRVVTNGYDPGPLATLTTPSRHDPRAAIRFTFLGTVTPAIPLRQCLDGWVAARASDQYVRAAGLEFYGYLGFYQTPDPRLAAELDRVANHAVSYHGAVKKSEVASIYNTADVLVLTFGGNRYVTSGKVFEYMATGRPIVSVHGPQNAVRDVLQGYPLWFPVTSLSVDDIAEAFVAAAHAVKDGRASDPETVTAALAHAHKFERRGVLSKAIEELPELIAEANGIADRMGPKASKDRPQICFCELPVPGERTRQFASALRGAGAHVRAVHDGYDPTVRTWGLEPLDVHVRARSLRQIAEDEIARADAAAPGTSAARAGDVAAMVMDLPVPASREIRHDTKLLSQQWFEVALALVESPSPIIWVGELSSLPPAIWAKKALPGVRVILDVQELWTEPGVVDDTQRDEWAEIALSFLPEVDALIAASTSIATELHDRYGVDDVVIVENLALAPYAHAGPLDPRSAMGLPADAKVVAWSPRTNDEDATDLIVDLLQRLPAMHVLVMGDGPEPEVPEPAEVGRTDEGTTDQAGAQEPKAVAIAAVSDTVETPPVDPPANAAADAAEDLLLLRRGPGYRLAAAASRAGVRNRLHFTRNALLDPTHGDLTGIDALLALSGASAVDRTVVPREVYRGFAAGVPVITLAESARTLFTTTGAGLVLEDDSSESLLAALESVIGDPGYAVRAREAAPAATWSTVESRLLDLVAEQLREASVPPLSEAGVTRAAARRQAAEADAALVAAATKATKGRVRYSWREDPAKRARSALAWRLRSVAKRIQP